MDKMSRHINQHKIQNNSGSKYTDYSNNERSLSINKRYSVDDNFYTYINEGDFHQNCSNNGYHTIGNRTDLKCGRRYSSRSTKREILADKQLAKDDITFKKFLKMFSSGENNRGAKDWITISASNMMDFAPKILTKRFCGKRGDNELYRSNSFKFERFEQKDMDTLTSVKKSPFSRQISLCDDYSLPVDFVNKRPLSLDSGSFWCAQGSNGDFVEILNLYCNPKDTENQQNIDDKNQDILDVTDHENSKVSGIIDKEYSQPCGSTSSESEKCENDAFELYENLKYKKFIEFSNLSHSSINKINTYTEVRKSPYYYGDLLKRSQSEEQSEYHLREPNPYRKCHSLDVPDGNFVTCQNFENQSVKNVLRRRDSPVNSFDFREDLEEDESMANRQRPLYETAFDSKICRSNETLDLDIVTNQIMDEYSPQRTYNSVSRDSRGRKYGSNNKRPTNNAQYKGDIFAETYDLSMDNLSQHLSELDIDERTMLLRGFSSMSTSTIPVPHQQSGCSYLNESLESFNSNEMTDCNARVKETRVPYCRIKNSNNNNNVNNNNRGDNNTQQCHPKHKHSQCCRKNENLNSCSRNGCNLSSKILEIKNRPRKSNRTKFSSTESITASSTDGSLESIRSSTSDGNRSTTSTDSHRSSSLSSHSSDSAVESGSYNFCANFQLRNKFQIQNKMQVLSPISDKSFQEQVSENSEISKNNNSRIMSPEENDVCSSPDAGEKQPQQSANFKSKRRLPQNKPVANLNLPFIENVLTADAETHHCSDSGISVESRNEVVTKQIQNFDFSDLPFDMPKLRRRRSQQMQINQNSTQDTSSSATSVELKDLPFDMPKLKKKLLKSFSAQDSSIELKLNSNDSVSKNLSTNGEQSGDDAVREPLKSEPERNRRSLGLNLNLNEIMNVAPAIDSRLPLERQGWYHGAITRMEAENELRTKEEGSYLVRNSESIKNDYSLSLKSAKGYMHMRIQKTPDTNKFILGQFSSPFDSIPQMINHYSSNQLPIRGAEHMCLLQPVIVQLL